MEITSDELKRLDKIISQVINSEELCQLYDKDKLRKEYIVFIKGLYISLVNKDKILEKYNRKSLLVIINCTVYFMTSGYNYQNYRKRNGEKIKDSEVLSMLSFQVVNYVKSILINESNILEAPARVVFRSLIELCWILNSITYDENKRKLFVVERAKDHKIQIDIWNQNFSPKELKKCISQIEKKATDDNELLKYMKDFRGRLFSSYSEFTHNNFDMLLNTTFYFQSERSNFNFNIGELVSLTDEEINWRSQLLDDMAQQLCLTVYLQQYTLFKLNELIIISDSKDTWSIYQIISDRFAKIELMKMLEELNNDY